MDNIEKLLRALIDELGYEIEETNNPFEFDTGLNGGKRFKMVDIINYKVTKKQPVEVPIFREWFLSAIKGAKKHDFGESVL